MTTQQNVDQHQLAKIIQRLLDIRREALALVDGIERLLIENGTLSSPSTAQLRKEYKARLSPRQTATCGSVEVEITNS